MKYILKIFLWALIMYSTSTVEAQKNDNIALTPAMGWNSWNRFRHNIDENLIKQIADAMVSTGLKDAGYTYVNLDDTWQSLQRDSDGFIKCDANKFPSGMRALANYIHSKGLKLGIYSDAGRETCAGLPGSFGHEYQDAIQYARWEIDYLKHDWCNVEDINPIGAYRLMRDALHSTGRSIYYSICEGGKNKPWLWAAPICHSWRTTLDINKTFSSVLSIIEQEVPLRQYAGPGHWNDPDMLEVGNGMKVNEDRAHFTMWCMLSAPLILGNDLRHMSKETLKILTNKDVIALDQDKLGVQALKFATKDSLDIWFKPLENGDWACCFLNVGSEPLKYTIDWQSLNLTDEISKRSLDFKANTYQLFNLWTKKKDGVAKKLKKVIIPGHDVIAYRLSLNTKY
jgi:alpha-galactosidase